MPFLDAARDFFALLGLLWFGAVMLRVALELARSRRPD